MDLEPKLPMVYVAGPISTGDYIRNVRAGIDVATRLLRNGIVPFCPHLSAFWDLIEPVSWDEWLEMDKEIIKRCNALFRMPGASRGGDVEVQFAKGLGLPVFFDEDYLFKWARDWAKLQAV